MTRGTRALHGTPQAPIQPRIIGCTFSANRSAALPCVHLIALMSYARAASAPHYVSEARHHYGLKQQDHLQYQPGRAMRAAQHTVAPAAARKDRHKSAGTEMFGALSAFRLMTPEEVVLGGSILNVLLAGLKAGAGAVTGSAALIADAGHSLSDLLSDAFALAAARVPRWERTCTQGIALMLLTTGATMMYTSGGALLTALRAPSLIITSGSTALDSVGLLIALLSIASKEALYHLTYVVGVRHKSSTLVANAHHHRSDALSSMPPHAASVAPWWGCSCSIAVRTRRRRHGAQAWHRDGMLRGVPPCGTAGPLVAPMASLVVAGLAA